MRTALALTLLFLCSPVRADDFYVAADGDDGNPGTLDQPFGTVERGQMAASAGDTVYLRGGEYHFSGTQATIGVAFTKSGTSGQPINYFAYQDEVPIFDLFDLKPQARVTGLDVHCNWIHLRGLEVRGVRQLIVGDSWSVRIRGDHNVVERLNVHDGEAPGIFITSGASNLVLNCDSHHNYDPLEDGGNADGFGCHSTGSDNVLRGCRAYENSDDGFDFINAAGACTAEDSWAFRNGFIPDTDMAVGNGAGFKSGGYGIPPNTPAGGAAHHVIRRNLAFDNLIGIYANYHTGGIDFFNNTAFDNRSNYDMRPAPGVATTHTLRNNIAAGTGNTIVSFTGGGTDDSNSWTLPVDVSSADFVSMDEGIGLQPRNADGSLPSMLMRLVDGSDLIDRGEDVGFPFTGSAPDLGAYEWGQSTTVEPIDAGMPDATISTDGGAQTSGTGGTQGNPIGTGGAPAKPSGSGGSTQPPLTGAGGAMTQKPGTSPPQSPSIADDPGAAESGCGCRVTPARGSASAPVVVLATLSLLLRTRRRTR